MKNRMKEVFLITLGLLLVISGAAFAQQKTTGLSNVKLFLDPGHSLKENQGMYKYSEAEKTLRVAKAIKEYLVTYTDIGEANVRLCRENDNTSVTLTQRTDMANAWGAHFFYSIHSDAGATQTSANTTLFMYGGWRVSGEVFEKDPKGGKDYGNILSPNLTGVMGLVTGTRGNVADRTYYDAAQTHTNRYPYLHVNRESHMASLLSEAGFHTHYLQQARNLNAEYKRLEGYAAYQSLVKFLGTKYGTNPSGANPVQIGIATGMITDAETGVALNGAKITIVDGATTKEYTTDTYESLFHNYSTNPNELHNGFYFIEGLTPGATVNVTVTASGYQTKVTPLIIPATIGATTKNGIGILNVALNTLPSEPPVVVSYGPESGSLQEESARPIVRIEFSKPLKTTTIAPNQITVTDSNGKTVGGTQKYSTVNGKSVIHYFFTSDLRSQETYNVTLARGIEDLYGNAIATGLKYAFTARPREWTVTNVLDNFNTIASSCWAPGVSGSTLGLNKDASQRIHSDDVSSLQSENTGSMRLDYLWLANETDHLIREHSTLTSPKFSKDNVVQMYLFGDGSYCQFRIVLRNGSTGTFWTNGPITVDWVGWKLISWDLSNDPFVHWLTNDTGPMPTGNNLNLSAMGLEGASTDKITFTPSYILFDELQLVTLGNFLTPVKDPNITDKISIVTTNKGITVSAAIVINDIKVYTITGELVKTVRPDATTWEIPTGNLPKGVYIVKATTATSQNSVKVIVKELFSERN